MSKYIKVFDTLEEYTTYSGSTGFVSPNISYVKANDKSYYDNNEIKHYTQNTWIFGGDEYDGSKSPFGKQYFNPTFSIKQIIIPDKDANGNNITGFYTSCFSNYYALESVTLNNNITSIVDYCFSGCKSLKSIDIPNCVTTIDRNAFQYCTSLTSCTIGSGVTSIGHYAFYNCTDLASIDIPSGVTSIGEGAFQNCSGLTSCTIGSGVTSINRYAFAGCSGLTSITINAVTPPTLASYNSFNNTDCPIYVPSESVDAYKSATNWSTYASKIQAIPNN